MSNMPVIDMSMTDPIAQHLFPLGLLIMLIGLLASFGTKESGVGFNIGFIGAIFACVGLAL